MKFSLALIAAATTAASVEAFAPAAFGIRTSTAQFERVDTSSLIEEARAASEKFGPESSEARLAWEAVEEVDSADNSEATKPSLDVECDIDEGLVSADCAEYSSKVDELASIIDQQEPIKMSQLAEQIKAIRLTVPESKAGASSPQLVEALKNAKAITEEKGIESAEARVAWDNVEEISAAGTDNSMGTNFSDECIVESASEACVALEELQRVLESNRS